MILVLSPGVDARTKRRTATTLLLLLCVPKHSLAFQGSFSARTSGSGKGSRLASASMDVAQPSTGGLSEVCLSGYWGIGTPQQGVPDKVLQAIREEPWRGHFEPCVDHPLTETEVEGTVPKALQGTLFRNGES